MNKKKLTIRSCMFMLVPALSANASEAPPEHIFLKPGTIQLGSDRSIDRTDTSAFSFRTKAATNKEGPRQRERALLYFNGMFTDNDALDINTPAIRSAMSYQFDVFEHVSNENEFTTTQLAEVLAQKRQEESHLPEAGFWTNAAYYLLGGVFLEPSGFTADLIDEFNQPTDQDLETMIRTTINYINSGFNVVILAHSQGNFYANSTYNEIARRYGDTFLRHLEVVAVATPSSVTSGGGPYTTNSYDKIINGVRKLRPEHLEPKPANITIPIIGDKSGHGLGETYIRQDPLSLAHLESKEKIRQDVINAYEKMEALKENEDDGGNTPTSSCTHNGERYSVTFDGFEEHTPSHTQNDTFSGHKRTFWPPVGTKFNLVLEVWGASPSKLYNNVQFNWKFGKYSHVYKKGVLNNTFSESNEFYYNPETDGNFTIGVRHLATDEAAYSVNWRATLSCVN
ncbi:MULTISPECIES: hypothetical protein [unclassified Pseudoalteromonas]|uniref:hypothetical protein n=1 Tax=unclassified Pseudoalteromonas TaxID=194690 RepID=UPI002096AD63|nr:hypothetical protein [Pseudoalteromonas sp. XMcav2-N]MCO7187404.1 hypothetical protein [Pseudoalteromonas sp. XMcav2-N]